MEMNFKSLSEVTVYEIWLAHNLILGGYGSDIEGYSLPYPTINDF